MASRSKNNHSLLIMGTHGKSDPQKACLTLMCANAASALGVQVTLFLMEDGVDLAMKKGLETWPLTEGVESVLALRRAFLEGGGRLLVCIPCMEVRHIGKELFIPDAKFINLMDFTEEIMKSEKVLSC